MDQFEHNGNKYTTHPDGRTEITRADGSSLVMSEDGVTVSIDRIDRVGIHNITDLTSYKLSESGGVVKHEFEFKNGGSFAFEYTTEGKILNCGGKNVGAELTKDNAFIVKMNSEK